MRPTIKLLTAVFVTLGLLAGTPRPCSAGLIIQASDSTVTVGDTMTVDLLFSGTDPVLGAFDITLNYSPQFSFDSYSLTGLLGDLSVLEAVDVSLGDGGTEVNVGVLSLLSSTDLTGLQTGRPDPFLLATLSFTATSAGNGLFAVASFLLADADGIEVATQAPEGAAVSVEEKDDPPTDVPEPAVAPLLAIAAAALIGRARKHHR